MKTIPSYSPLFPLRAAMAVVAVGFAASLFGQTGTTASSSSDTSALKHGDRRFIEKAAQSGREEVEIAQIALERSTNADVKKFAQMMVDDHGRANQELAALAGTRGVALKDKPKSENKWSRKDAKSFDHDYVKKMVSDHKEAIQLFSNESKNGGDPELVEFARKTLKTLEHHLEEASTLEKTVP